MNRQTTLAKNHEEPRNWVHVDASDKIVGRLAVQIATVLMGKNKPTYTPHHDVGDFVVVTNAQKLTMTGRKLDHKVAQSFSGHPGGRKTTSYRELMENKPERVLELVRALSDERFLMLGYRPDRVLTRPFEREPNVEVAYGPMPVQAALLERLRSTGPTAEGEGLRAAVLTATNGIAAGLRNTG
ncbi:MAG: 50S ribosomal protein L13 [Phycisphaeraceae bacterium]